MVRFVKVVHLSKVQSKEIKVVHQVKLGHRSSAKRTQRNQQKLCTLCQCNRCAPIRSAETHRSVCRCAPFSSAGSAPKSRSEGAPVDARECTRYGAGSALSQRANAHQSKCGSAPTEDL